MPDFVPAIFELVNNDRILSAKCITSVSNYDVISQSWPPNPRELDKFTPFEVLVVLTSIKVTIHHHIESHLTSSELPALLPSIFATDRFCDLQSVSADESRPIRVMLGIPCPAGQGQVMILNQLLLQCHFDLSSHLYHYQPRHHRPYFEL